MRSWLSQIICSWTKRHDWVVVSSRRHYCSRCGRGWFFDPVWYLWRPDTDTPGSAP